MIQVHTVDHVAEMFSLSRETVLRRCKRREWPHHRDGRSIYFTDTDLEQIVSAGAVQVAVDDGRTERSRQAHSRLDAEAERQRRTR